MSPETLVIDRFFRGVGRIKKASGTTVPAVKKKMNRMLTELYEIGRLDLLRDIRDNRITLLEVLDAWQRRALDSLAAGPTAQGLAVAWQAWIDKQEEGVDYSAKHIESMGTSLGYLLVADAGARVNDLPALLERLRDTLGREHPRSFNMTRSNAMTFVAATLKRSHPLYLAIQAVEPRPVPKRAPRPDITVEWMRSQFPNEGTDALDSAVWAMALTGMGPKEYWGDWEVLSDRIVVRGTKRESRDRVVPLTSNILWPILSSNALRLRLYRRFGGKISAYDFRRTFARWMERAGIVRARRKMYMGHASGDVTGLYEAHEIDAYLVEDARAMRTFLGLPEPTPQPLRQVK